MDEAIKLLGSEAIKLLGYEAIRLYGHMAVNTELNTEFGADPIYCQPHWVFSEQQPSSFSCLIDRRIYVFIA